MLDHPAIFSHIYSHIHIQGGDGDEAILSKKAANLCEIHRLGFSVRHASNTYTIHTIFFFLFGSISNT
jgi:hypothetical protein